MSSLQQRLITAVVLAGLFVAAVAWVPTMGLALVFGGVALLAGWEWAALAGWTHAVARVIYCVCLAIVLLGLWWICDLAGDPKVTQVQPIMGIACLFWSVALLQVRQYPRSTWLWRSSIVRSLVGWLMLAATWLAIMYALSLQNGALLVVLLVLTVAAADVGAYFAGRRWGQHKLAPSVSPGKTWEGLWGGIAAVLVLVVIVSLGLPNSYSHITTGSIVALALIMAGASVLGDLTVSMVKRHVGVKDSGALLPGHGGVLDRLDSVCGAAPVFGLGLLLMGFR